MGGLDSGVYSSAHNRSHHSSHGQGREASPSERLIVGVTVRCEKALDCERKRLIRQLTKTRHANHPRFISLSGYCSFAYSALACLRMGMSGSASFQRVRKSL